MGWIVFLAVGLLVANGPATAPAQLQPLIDQLGGENWQQRQTAQDQLVALGEEARAALEQAARDSTDPEVRSRAEAALAQITENAQIGPSIITIRGENLSVREVVRQLSQQCGVQLDAYPPDALDQHREKYSFDLDHAPFWTAVAAITEKTGFALQPWDQAGMVFMQGAAPPEGISSVAGAFLVSAVRVSRSRSVELAGAGAVYEDFNVQIGARAEPKLRLLRASYMPRLERAEDENGKSLLPQDGQLQTGFTFGPGSVLQLTARLHCPPEVGKRIAIIRGGIDVSIQTRAARLEVPDIRNARSVTRAAGGVRFTVHQLTRNGDNWQLAVTVQPEEAAGQQQWERIQQIVSMADMKLLDDRGEPLHRGSQSTTGGAGQMEMSVEFTSRGWGRNRQPGEPSVLVWTVPTATKDIVVPFEFRDLPIP